MKPESDIRQVLSWLRLLEANNDRPWFKAHKAEYDALRQPWEHDMARLITLVGDYDDNVRGLMPRDCIYRIYRDVRFSKNKAPYKTYFSCAMGRGGRHTIMSSYYVHFEPGMVMLGGGVWWPEKAILDKMRALIDAEPEEWLRIVRHPDIAGRYQWMSETLKTMPKGYSREHPLAEYLRMKEYILMIRPGEDYFDCADWVERVAGDLRALKPMHDFLNYVFD